MLEDCQHHVKINLIVSGVGTWFVCLTVIASHPKSSCLAICLPKNAPQNENLLIGVFPLLYFSPLLHVLVFHALTAPLLAWSTYYGILNNCVYLCEHRLFDYATSLHLHLGVMLTYL